ncbi:MAG: CPBP family intramembrane metalloprotease [Phycisphaeraceae bacterium]|nr:CPBP family intramembrane metalloprotease [Phycisphaeraceae bacterium]
MSPPLHVAPHEPGSARAAMLAWMIALVLLGLTVYLQQSAAASRAAPPTAGAPASIEPPGNDGLVIMSRLAVRFRSEPAIARSAAETLLGMAAELRERDRVRLAIVLNDIDPLHARGNDLLARVEAALPPQRPSTDPLAGELLQDVRLLRNLYAQGPAALTPQDFDRLERHHGFFGRLARLFGTPDGDPARSALVPRETWPVYALAAFIIFGCFAAITGLVLCILLLQQVRSRIIVPVHRPAAPGGSLGIELLAVFVAGFIAVKLLVTLAHATAPAGQASQAAAWTGLLAQWLLLPLVLLYPRWRAGAAASGEFLGLTAASRRAGLVREVLVGIAAWCACIPLLVLGALASVALSWLWSLVSQPTGAGSPAPGNPVIDLLSGFGNPWQIAVVVALAVVWAPIVEELVFRGGLYGHLRTRFGVLSCAVASAVIFGLMHGYPLLMLGPVIGLGVGFAITRHLRGSLIAGMTAHALHNGLVVAFLLVAIRALGL